MSAPKRYTDEVKADAVRRYMAGESSPKIAADIGCTNTTIMSWVNKSFTTPETPKRSEDTTMIEEKAEKVEMTVKETPAAAATATDEKPNVSKYSSYLYDSTEKQFCQALLTTICELADDIISTTDNVEVAGYAGRIGGLADAVREVVRE